MKMEIEYNNKKVSIISKENWSYDEVHSKKLFELNCSLQNEIQKKVNYYVDNKEKIDAENKAKADAKKIAKHQEQVDLFKTDIELTYGPLLKEYEVSFSKPSKNDYSFNSKMLEIKIPGIYTSVKISYDNKVYRGNSWHASTTSQCWVSEFDYKKRRYTKIETAIKKAIEKLEEYKLSKARELQAEDKKKLKELRLKEFAESNGFEYSKDYHSSRHSRGYYTYSMKNDKLSAIIHYNETSEEVVIISFTVTNKNRVIEIKDLMELVK